MGIRDVRDTINKLTPVRQQERHAFPPHDAHPVPQALQATPRLVGASRGDPFNPHSVSGVAYHLFNALARHYPLVARIDTRLSRWQIGRVALATFHPSRERWQERYFKNIAAFKLQSRNSRAQLAHVAQPFDLVMQVYGLFRTVGAPYVVYLDNTHEQSVQHWPEWNPLRGQALEEWYASERTMYQHAQHVFTTSKIVAQSTVQFYGVPAAQVSVVGGGANFDTLPTLPTTERVREPVILFVGREYRRKGGDVLLQAFRQVRAQLPNARLQIVGTSDIAPEAGVEVLGSISNRQQISDLYAQASVFCLPSRFDPFPGVLSEAMAYGVPCVSTSVCGIPEIVLDEQTGLLVPHDDSHALAQALVRVLDNPAYAARLGATGRLRVEQHLNWDLVVDRMAPVLDRLGTRMAEQRTAMRDNHASAFNGHTRSSIESY